MPEKSFPEWCYGLITAFAGWAGYLHTSRLSNKTFGEYKDGHAKIHEILCDKMDAHYDGLRQGQDRIEESVNELRNMFLRHLERHEEDY